METSSHATRRSRSGLTKLSRHSVETIKETSSHATRPGNAHQQSSQFAELPWTDPWPLGVKLVRASLSVLERKARAGSELWNLPSYSPNAGKSPRTAVTALLHDMQLFPQHHLVIAPTTPRSDCLDPPVRNLFDITFPLQHSHRNLRLDASRLMYILHQIVVLFTPTTPVISIPS